MFFFCIFSKLKHISQNSNFSFAFHFLQNFYRSKSSDSRDASSASSASSGASAVTSPAPLSVIDVWKQEMQRKQDLKPRHGAFTRVIGKADATRPSDSVTQISNTKASVGGAAVVAAARSDIRQLPPSKPPAASNPSAGSTVSATPSRVSIEPSDVTRASLYVQ